MSLFETLWMCMIILLFLLSVALMIKSALSNEIRWMIAWPICWLTMGVCGMAGTIMFGGGG